MNVIAANDNENCKNQCAETSHDFKLSRELKAPEFNNRDEKYIYF